MLVQDDIIPQTFKGRAYCRKLTNCSKRNFYKNATKQINSMKVMKNADFDLYISDSPFKKTTAIMAMKDFKSDFHTGDLVPETIPAIVSAARRIIQEHSTKIQENEIKHKSLFKRFIHFINPN